MIGAPIMIVPFGEEQTDREDAIDKERKSPAGQQLPLSNDDHASLEM
jgi:hypothetical protein